MSDFELQAGDVLVNVDRKKDIWSKVKRWAMGSPYSHVFLYMGEPFIGNVNVGMARIVPMLFESNGRGVSLQSLSNRYGQDVVVMRLKDNDYDKKKIPHVLFEAIALASEISAYYDYFCIIKFVLPRIICEKLHLPMPLSWHRDSRQICSEAVLEIFLRAKCYLLPKNRVPLPGDFVTDTGSWLEKVWEGELSSEVT